MCNVLVFWGISKISRFPVKSSRSLQPSGSWKLIWLTIDNFKGCETCLNKCCQVKEKHIYSGKKTALKYVKELSIREMCLAFVFWFDLQKKHQSYSCLESLNSST